MACAQGRRGMCTMSLARIVIVSMQLDKEGKECLVSMERDRVPGHTNA